MHKLKKGHKMSALLTIFLKLHTEKRQKEDDSSTRKSNVDTFHYLQKT